MVGILVAAFLVEPVLLGLAPGVARFGPMVALPTAVSGIPPEDAGLGDVDLLAPRLAALALLAWITAAYVAGALLLRHPDVD